MLGGRPCLTELQLNDLILNCAVTLGIQVIICCESECN